MRIKGIKGFTPLEKVIPMLHRGGRNRKSSLTGFTLLETLVVVGIFSILVLAIYGVLESGGRLWMVTDASRSNQFEARRAMMDMEREIRGGTNFTLISPYNSISFVLGGENISYARIDDGDYIERVTTEAGIPLRRLANNIKSLEFIPDVVINPEKVIITISVEKTTLRDRNIEFNLTQQVTVRN